MADAEQVRFAAFQAPYNALASARQLLGPETKFVSPNNTPSVLDGTYVLPAVGKVG